MDSITLRNLLVPGHIPRSTTLVLEDGHQSGVQLTTGDDVNNSRAHHAYGPHRQRTTNPFTNLSSSTSTSLANRLSLQQTTTSSSNTIEPSPSLSATSHWSHLTIFPLVVTLAKARPPLANEDVHKISSLWCKGFTPKSLSMVSPNIKMLVEPLAWIPLIWRPDEDEMMARHLIHHPNDTTLAFQYMIMTRDEKRALGLAPRATVITLVLSPEEDVLPITPHLACYDEGFVSPILPVIQRQDPLQPLDDWQHRNTYQSTKQLPVLVTYIPSILLASAKRRERTLLAKQVWVNETHVEPPIVSSHKVAVTLLSAASMLPQKRYCERGRVVMGHEEYDEVQRWDASSTTLTTRSIMTGLLTAHVHSHVAVKY